MPKFHRLCGQVGQAYFLSHTIGFYGNAATTIVTARPRWVAIVMAPWLQLAPTNCSYETPVKTLLNSLRYIDYG